MDFYLYNFPVLKNKEYLEDLYLNKKYSLPMIKELANNKNDTFQFPRSKITAEDIWKMDKYKKYIAKVNNFIVLYFWEKEIKELSEDVLAKKVKDCIDIENTKKLAAI